MKTKKVDGSLKFVCLSCNSALDKKYSIPTKGKKSKGSFCDGHCALIWITEHASSLGKEEAAHMAKVVQDSFDATSAPSRCMQTVEEYLAQLRQPEKKRKRESSPEPVPVSPPLKKIPEGLRPGGPLVNPLRSQYSKSPPALPPVTTTTALDQAQRVPVRIIDQDRRNRERFVHSLKLVGPGVSYVDDLNPRGPTLCRLMAEHGKWQMNKHMGAKVNGNTVTFFPLLEIDPKYARDTPATATLTINQKCEVPEVNYIPR